MKRIIILLFVLLVSIPVLSDGIPVKEIENEDKDEAAARYDVFAHEDTASMILMGWGGATAAAGASMFMQGNEFVSAMGLQHMMWGAVDTGIGWWIKNTISDRKKTVTPEIEREWFKEMLGLNVLLDIGYMAIGGAMLAFGDDNIAGHGAGILGQGLFLFAFDGINFLICGGEEEKK